MVSGEIKNVKEKYLTNGVFCCRIPKDVKQIALTRRRHSMEALEMTLLFDYYGDLLTERQRACLDLRYNQDLSLGEIAQELGVSRQGVFDNLSRAEALLRNMEEKTGCVRRAKEARRAVSKVLSCANILASNSDETVASLAAQIIEAAQKLEE